MKNHTKVYLDYFGFTEQDWIGCEVCGKWAVDIHHLEPRGMGGSKTKDTPENLMALCRACHIEAEAKRLSKNYLQSIHNSYISALNP